MLIPIILLLHTCCMLSHFSHVRLFATLWTIASQVPLSRDSPGKNIGVGCHFLLQGIFLTQGSNPCLLCLLHWQMGSFYLLIYFNWRLITSQYCDGFCHTLTWISHRCTCVSHPQTSSHLPPHPIPLGCPSALALSVLFHASNLDWSSISHMIIYTFQCYSLKSSHPHLLPQSPKVCCLYLCLFCCLAYRVVVTIFLNSIYVY